MECLTEALNTPRSLFSLNDSVRFLTSAVFHLFFGMLIQKLGAQKMVVIGFVCLMCAMQIYARSFLLDLWPSGLIATQP